MTILLSSTVLGNATDDSELRILVVDDDRDTADTTAMLLKSPENQIRTAYDGVEAVREACEFRPDVIVLDIGLPKLNGYEVCRFIRKLPWGKNVIAIAVTGWGQARYQRWSEEAGFDRFLVKPVDPLTLLKVIAELACVKV